VEVQQPTRMKAEERRQQLLTVALDLFSRQGFDGTTIRDIAAAANVTEGLIYKHFASKEELLEEVIARARKRLYNLDYGSLSGRDPEESIAGLLRTFAGLIRAHLSLIDLIWIENCRCSELAPRLSVLRDESCQQVESIIRAWLADGVLQIDHPLYAARLLQGAGFSFAIANRDLDDEAFEQLLADYAAHTAKIFIHGTLRREDAG
jgi:AcrR family transcriptional regulator